MNNIPSSSSLRRDSDRQGKQQHSEVIDLEDDSDIELIEAPVIKKEQHSPSRPFSQSKSNGNRNAFLDHEVIDISDDDDDTLLISSQAASTSFGTVNQWEALAQPPRLNRAPVLQLYSPAPSDASSHDISGFQSSRSPNHYETPDEEEDYHYDDNDYIIEDDTTQDRLTIDENPIEVPLPEIAYSTLNRILIGSPWILPPSAPVYDIPIQEELGWFQPWLSSPSRWSRRSFTTRLSLAQHEKSTQFGSFSLQESSRIKLGGSPNVIAQNSNWVAIATATQGINPISAANREGLTLWSTNEAYSLDNAHAVGSRPVYYGVNDVAFDPACEKSFISVGKDKHTIIWKIDEARREEYASNRASPFITQHSSRESDSAPSYIKFNPNRSTWTRNPVDEVSMYAVGCENGDCFITPCRGETFKVSIDLCSNSTVQAGISTMCWGSGPTENLLFCGTEEPDGDGPGRINSRGQQRALQVLNDRRPVEIFYTGCEDEAEALVVNQAGNLLASLTRGYQDSISMMPNHTLSLYSMNTEQRSTRKNTRKPDFEVHLKPFHDTSNKRKAGTVVTAAWSPCDTYIAVARDDDIVDLFDRRFMKSTINRLKHKRLPGNLEFGITEIQWIQGIGSMGLVSGGSDHRVCLWDIRKDTENMTILATLEKDVSVFSVRDVTRRTIPLIAADCDGSVSFFERGDVEMSN